jgi:fatty acid desaturase
MESKKITIIGAWGFLIVLWILSYFGNWDLLWPLILVFIVLIVTVAVSFTPETPSSDAKLSEEIKEVKSRVEATAKDVENIKKIIEE